MGVVLLLAVGLGLVGGAVLSFAPYLVLGRQVQGASIWIPANMLPWLVSMPIIFGGVDTAQQLASLGGMIVFMAGMLLLTGSIVGAIHGVFMLRLAGRLKNNPPRTGSIISPS